MRFAEKSTSAYLLVSTCDIVFAQPFLYVLLTIWLKQTKVDRKFEIVSKAVATHINFSNGLWIKYLELQFFFHP